MGRGRQPLSDTQLANLSELSKTLQCLLWEHGFTDQPVGGCPIPNASGSPVGNPQGEDVNQIVRSVVAELKRRGMIG